jgi:hypothetical protein
MICQYIRLITLLYCEYIQESKAGLAVGKLRQHKSKAVADAAKEIVKKWKTDVEKAKGSPAPANPAPAASTTGTPFPVPRSLIHSVSVSVFVSCADNAFWYDWMLIQHEKDRFRLVRPFLGGLGARRRTRSRRR